MTADGEAPRERAAAALRRLGHAVVGHDVDTAVLERIAQLADATAAAVERGTPRHRPIAAIKRRLWEEAPPSGEGMSHFPECVVSGQANPMGIAIVVRREGDEVVADFNLGAAFEGAPQRAHGGVIAAIFDDVMGYVLVLERTPAFTGKLRVSYRARVPVGTDLSVRARLRDRDGRKLWMEAEITDADGRRLADADALFIAIRPEWLAQLPDGAESAPATSTRAE